jgi:small basic protein (TIGR04137 family)
MSLGRRYRLPGLLRHRLLTTNAGRGKTIGRPDDPLAMVDFVDYCRRPKALKVMSQHRSLKGASTIQTKRNVLKRFERVELLKKRGVFKPGDRVIGLPKTKPDA